MSGILTAIQDINGVISNIVWGPIMLVLLIGTGLLLSIRMGFPQFTRFGYVMKNTIGDDIKWLQEGVVYNVLLVDGNPVSVDLPNTVEMEVAVAAEGLRGDTSSAPTKAVTLANGVVLQVPLFIKQGDKIRVRTEDNAYISRA